MMKTKNEHVYALSGVLLGYKSNKHQDIDGFRIDQAGNTVEVKFPPHTARFIQEIARPNDAVDIRVREKPHGPHKEAGHDHKRKLELVSIGNSSVNSDFAVHSIEPPHPAETGGMQSFTIKDPQFTTGGKHAEITGVAFEGKYFHLHPHESGWSEDELKAAASIRLKAKKRRDDAGFVNEHGYAVYHTHSMDIGQ